jgi:hypothetical protein
MTSKQYVAMARKNLSTKSIEELGDMMRNIAEEENVVSMLEDVRQHPEHKDYMVELLLEYAAIGIFNDDPNFVMDGKNRVKGSTLQFQSTGHSPIILTVSQCAQCQKSSTDQKLLKCSRCQNCYYCSKECQKIHWKLHKQICLPS